MTDTKISFDMYLNKKYESLKEEVSTRFLRKLNESLSFQILNLLNSTVKSRTVWVFGINLSQFFDDKIEKDDKFQYLIQSVSEERRAREIINSYPPINENYSKPIGSLKSRFGKDELL
ncbi:hypothetical protein TNCV_3685781 [Trichonephila clavipes]|nr:hypothetical protein TNCV_3685781 [Trichonephila clavipes]